MAGLCQGDCDVSLASVPVTCPGDGDGSLTVVPGTPGLYTYNWAHDPTLNNATATNLPPGPYTVAVSDTSGCFSILEGEVGIPFVQPLGTVTTTDITCAGNNDGTVTFTVNPGPYTWQWTSNPAETNTTLTGLGPGTYAVLIEGGVCPSLVAGFLGDPGIEIEGNAVYCPAAPPVLNAGSTWGFSPHIYIWSTGDTTASFTVEPDTEGLVEVTAIDTTIGCVASGSIFLTILPSPTVTFSAPDTVCERVDFVMNMLTSDADSLVWRWGTSGFSNLTDPVANLADPFWQPVSLQGFDAFGCGNQPVRDSVYVRPRLRAIYTAEHIPCTTLVELDFQSIADSCAFFIGDSLVLGDCDRTLVFDFEEYDVYDIVFYSTQPNRCDDTLALTIDVRLEPTLFLPTAFTPNDDGINDEWPGPVDIPEKDFLLQIFDRWGTMLWTTTDTQMKWQGIGLPSDIYVYTMRMRDPCQPQRVIAKHGSVMLLR
jgi:gliding motility-associated-like protein